ncbi:MAG: hypothetical protein ACRBBK_01725 [Paracoccaceae bacterium]
MQPLFVLRVVGCAIGAFGAALMERFWLGLWQDIWTGVNGCALLGGVAVVLGRGLY